MCCAWSSGVSPGTAISRLAGTSRTEGPFRLPSANEGKLQMRSRGRSPDSRWDSVQPSTREAVGVGIAVVLDNETVPRKTALGTDGRQGASRKLSAESWWGRNF